MSYFTGDIPAEPLVISPARNDDPIDLEPFDTATATLRDDTGSIVPDYEMNATIAGDEIMVEWDATSPFEASGVYYVGVVLTGTNVRERLMPVPVVVEDDNDGWLTLDAARALWPDAPQDDLQLFEILWTAKQQVIQYAPALELGERVPRNYKTGQQMQARNIWNANKVAPDSGGFGQDTFVLRPFPLDWMVKQMLRPSDAVPRVQ